MIKRLASLPSQFPDQHLVLSLLVLFILLMEGHIWRARSIDGGPDMMAAPWIRFQSLCPSRAHLLESLLITPELWHVTKTWRAEENMHGGLGIQIQAMRILFAHIGNYLHIHLRIPFRPSVREHLFQLYALGHI